MNILPKTHCNYSLNRFGSNYLKRNLTESKDSSTKTFPIIEDPKAIKILFKDKVNVKKWDLESTLTVEDKINLTKNILNNNLETPLTELFYKKPWNIHSFNDPHLPTVIGQLENQNKFSKRKKDCYFLFMDMAISLYGKGYNIPKELSQFEEVITKAVKHERLINPKFHEYNVFLTVDQRKVNPGESQRRTGWHADSFINVETRTESLETNPLIETDSIYLVSDCIPTEFCEGPFPFNNIDPNNTEQLLNHFQTTAANRKVVTYPPYTLLRLSPECIHRVGINVLNKIIPRTFVKITFSKQILNREGNGINKFFDTNWPLFSRQSDKRNHSSIVSGYHQNIDQHRLIKEHELSQLFNSSDKKIAMKRNAVTAYLATPGELLQTSHEGFMTTVNVAKIGDWKITSATGSQYFLSSKKLNSLYSRNFSGTFTPQHIPTHFITLNEPICIMAPWGEMQYLRTGDYLVRKGPETYGILKNDFETNYKEVDKIS